MIRGLVIVLLALMQVVSFSQLNAPLTPDKIYGELFVDVQMKRIFDDSKAFVDCVPLYKPEDILAKYHQQKNQGGFNLKKFVLANFKLPAQVSQYKSKQRTDVVKHIDELWKVLQRNADSAAEGSSLLPLSHPYIVPGGRFREIYYWDSYFTMLGLKESKQYAIIESMVQNFAELINKYGHIPNGNRTYYLSRSQPPFFSLMVELLASIKGEKVYLQYADALQKEAAYWNTIQTDSLLTNDVRKIVVQFNNGKVCALNRYSDELNIARQESFFEDSTLAASLLRDVRMRIKFRDSMAMVRVLNYTRENLYHNLRSAAASGWDFSSRWLSDKSSLKTIRTAQISPVELNCLLYHEQMLNLKIDATQNGASKKLIDSTIADLSARTKKGIKNYFFNEQLGWYCDFDFEAKKVMNNPTLAGMYPLFFKLADKKDVPRIVAFLRKNFLKPGGVVTSPDKTGQQWDSPNGWAPLQWITIIGLENYGYHALAKEIAKRWVNLNKKVFKSTGKLMEKYDVINLNKPAGGGEYPSQDGFGWTNGVLLALIKKYKL